ncbi:MAG TPA: class I SAM-dependent methyltransferase [Dehalococcoidia bacterium]|nr:class I SAM-dependent methyltransferase [Dehalococcoidia bacterium]
MTVLGEQRGFSAMAAEYDSLAERHPIVIWMRQRIRRLVEGQVSPGASILEINAGSGLDAAYFASKGLRVHATDTAPGMLAALADKAAAPDVGGRLTYEALSFDRLSEAQGGPYDLVFSNLGGLNCTDDLAAVAGGLPDVLKPGGSIVWVVMPPVCPWEMAQALRGHVSTAKRRFSKGGTLANVGGEQVRTWYHSPGKLTQVLGPAFRVEALRSFCFFAPPSYFGGFVRRHPSVVRMLTRLDDALGGAWPVNRGGDFYALVARYRPET